MRRQTSWNAVASWYNDHLEKKDTHHRDIILPNLISRLGPAGGQTILDLACGQGFLSFEIYRHGASVIGVDLAPDLIALAKTKARDLQPSSKKSIAFHTAPAHRLPFIKNSSLDAAIIVLALQNIDNPAAVLLECQRGLKPNGRLLLVLNHPAFRVIKHSSWGFDRNTHTQYRRIDQYMSEYGSAITMHPGKKSSATTVSFHRPLQSYVKLLKKSGFAVTDLEEWVSRKHSDSGPRAKAENRARQEFPLFLFIEAEKKSP